MSPMELVVLLIIAAVAGAVGQSIAGYSLGGCLVSIAVGFIGALIGSWLAGTLGLPEVFVIQVGGQAFPVIWAIVGATLFTLLVGVVTRRRPPL